MLAIRLSRIGRKDRAIYRVVISEKSKDTYGKHLEQLGVYDPGQKPKLVEFKEDRVKHWLSKGAQPSPTVHNLFVDAGLIEGKKIKASKHVKPEPKEEERAVEEKKEETKSEGDEKKEETKEEVKEDKPAEEKRAEEKTEEAGDKKEEKAEDKKEDKE